MEFDYLVVKEASRVLKMPLCAQQFPPKAVGAVSINFFYVSILVSAM